MMRQSAMSAIVPITPKIDDFLPMRGESANSRSNI
jgi:hypothetical protein